MVIPKTSETPIDMEGYRLSAGASSWVVGDDTMTWPSGAHLRRVGAAGLGHDGQGPVQVQAQQALHARVLGDQRLRAVRRRQDVLQNHRRQGRRQVRQSRGAACARSTWLGLSPFEDVECRTMPRVKSGLVGELATHRNAVQACVCRIMPGVPIRFELKSSCP